MPKRKRGITGIQQLKKNAEKVRERRRNETSAEAAIRRAADAKYHRQRRENQLEAEAAFKRARDVARLRARRAREKVSVIVKKELAVIQQSSSVLNNSNLLDQVGSSGFSVEDHFEIKEENFIENDTEPETITPDQIGRTSNDKLIDDQKEVTLNLGAIKQEINSDQEELTSSTTTETPNSENIYNNDQSFFRAVSSQQNEEMTEKTGVFVNKEQVGLHENVIVENTPDGLVNMLHQNTSNDIEKNVQKSHCHMTPQFTTMEHCSFREENVQKEPNFVQQCHLNDSCSVPVSANENYFEKVKSDHPLKEQNVQTEAGITAGLQCFSESVQRMSQLATVQQRSSASGKNSCFQNVSMDNLLIEDQIEIKEENTVENEKESEPVISDQNVGMRYDNFIAGLEQVMLNKTKIKQEFNFVDEDLTGSIINETLNEENFAEDVHRINPELSQINEAKVFANGMEVLCDPSLVNMVHNTPIKVPKKTASTIVKSHSYHLRLPKVTHNCTATQTNFKKNSIGLQTIPKKTAGRSVKTQKNFERSHWYYVTDVQKSYRSVKTQVNFENKSSTNNSQPQLKPLPKEASKFLCGRRIIDFQYFFESLKDANNHSARGCGLNNMIITRERRNGLLSSYVLQCLVCNFEKVISSEDPSSNKDLNADFVSGILKIKCSFQDANVLFSEMLLPLLSHRSFVKGFDEVCVPLSKVANQNQNVLKKSRKTVKKKSTKTVKNKSQVATMPSICNQPEDVDSDCMIIEDENQIRGFKSQEEGAVDNENRAETMTVDQTVQAPKDKLICDKEQIVLNTTVEQEINSDDDCYITNETSNREKTVKNCERIIPRTVLHQKSKTRICEKRKISNQEQDKLQTNVLGVNNKSDNVSVTPKFNSIEMRDKESITDFDNKPESEISCKKARTVTYEQSHSHADTNENHKEVSSKEISNFQDKFKSNALVTSTLLTSVANVTSMAINMRFVTSPTITIHHHPTTSLTNEGKENMASIMPVQQMSETSESKVSMPSQMPHNIKVGTDEGKDTICMLTKGINNGTEQQVVCQIVDPNHEKSFHSNFPQNAHHNSTKALPPVKEVEPKKQEFVPKDPKSAETLLDCVQNYKDSFSDPAECTSSHSLEVSKDKCLQLETVENDIDAEIFQEKDSSSTITKLPPSGKLKNLPKELFPDKDIEVEKLETVPNRCSSPIIDCIQEILCSFGDSTACTSLCPSEASEGKSLKSKTVESDIDIDEFKDAVSSSILKELSSDDKLIHAPEVSSQVKEVKLKEQKTVSVDCSSPKTMLKCVQNSVSDFSASTDFRNSCSIEMFKEKNLESKSSKASVDMEDFQEIRKSEMRVSPCSDDLKHLPKASCQVKEVKAEDGKTVPLCQQLINSSDVMTTVEPASTQNCEIDYIDLT